MTATTRFPLVRLRRITKIKGGAGFPHQEQGNLAAELPFYKVKDLAEADRLDFLGETDNYVDMQVARRLGAFVFPRNTVFMAKVGAALLLHRFARASRPSCIDNNMLGLIPLSGELEPDFFVRCFATIRFDGVVNPGAVPSLSGESVGNKKIPLPSRGEQRAIASFLDRKTAAIDALIEKKERLIELLAEKRAALIHRAVTKGLNPDVPMKDSGVPWIGEIPAHWDEVQIRRVAEETDYGISESLAGEGRIAVLRMNNIQDGRLVLDDLKYVERVDKNLMLREGDLLFNRTNSWALVGKAAMVKEVDFPLSFASYLVRIRLNRQKAVSIYFAELLNSDSFLAQARSFAVPSISQANLSASTYSSLRIALPPIEEQRVIGTYLSELGSRIGAHEAKIRDQIARLREYRQALITAAVTGQLDIPEAAE